MKTIFTNLIGVINGSKFLSVLITTIFILFCICFIVYIIRLLSNIRMYIVNKSNSYYLENLKKKKPDNATLSMPDRIELTNSVLDLITFMVNNESVSLFKSYFSLNEKYDISRMDDDVQTISNNIFNGINKNLFIDPDLVLTEKYLMEFITKKTIFVILDIAQNHNNNLRNLNKSNED